MPEAEAAIDEALAVAPSYHHAHARKIWYLMGYRNDLAAARAQLEKAPSAYYTQEAFALMAGIVWLYSREPAKCLEALRAVSDYPQGSTIYEGPKAYLTGMAQRMMGNAEAARSDWRTALRVVEQRLTQQPNGSDLLEWKACLLAALGEHVAAEPLLREIRQRVSTGDKRLSEFGIAEILMLMGKSDDALASLEKWLASRREGPPSTSLRYNPVWDPLRGNPRFEALLKVAEPKK